MKFCIEPCNCGVFTSAGPNLDCYRSRLYVHTLLYVFFLVSHLYGFGLVDAEAMVLEATKWRTVPPQHTCRQIAEVHTR